MVRMVMWKLPPGPMRIGTNLKYSSMVINIYQNDNWTPTSGRTAQKNVCRSYIE